MAAEIQKFRVLFDCHTFDVGWQGTTTYLAGVINALPKMVAQWAPYLELEIICAASERRSIDRFVDVPYSFKKIRTGFIVRNMLDIPRASRSCGANLVVSQYVRPFFSNCPTLSVIHDVLFLDYTDFFSRKYRLSRKLLFGWSARNSSFVTSVSQYSAERIAHHLGVAQDAILVIPNAVDPAFSGVVRDKRECSNVLRLLSVSRLERRKRHEWGIDVLEALASKGVKANYTIIGGGVGAYSREIEAAVHAARSERGLDVVLKSGLDFRSLLQEYANADVFLCPSHAEGFGIPVIEAGAVGIPCVSTNGGALSELESNFIGVMTCANDREAFIDAVCMVARDINVYAAEATRLRTQVTNRYSWDRCAKAYVDLFQRVAAGNCR